MPKIVGKYKLVKTIGRGNFSNVKEVMDLDSKKKYVMKIIKISDIKESGKEDEIRRRIDILSKMSHPGIVNIRSLMHSDSHFYLLFDSVENLLLKKIEKSWPLSEKTARKYFQQLIDILGYLHNHGATFRDLCLENILIDSRDNLRISDFIFSNIQNKRLIRESQEATKNVSHCFLRYYVAPEALNTDGYVSPSADIYSAGVILYQMLYGTLPFEGSHPEQLELNKRNGIKQFPGNASLDSSTETILKKLIKIMLDPEPHNRPSIVEIRKNKWFKEDYKEIKGNDSRRSNVLTDIQVTVTYSANTELSTVSLNSEINGFELISRVCPVKLDHAVDTPDTSNIFEVGDSVDSPTSFTISKPSMVTIDLIDRLLKGYKAWVCKSKKERIRKAIIPVCSKKYQIKITVSKIEDELTLVEIDRISGDVPGFLDLYQKIQTQLNKM